MVIRIVGGLHDGKEVNLPKTYGDFIKLAGPCAFNVDSLESNSTSVEFSETEYRVHKFKICRDECLYFAAPPSWTAVDVMLKLWGGYFKPPLS